MEGFRQVELQALALALANSSHKSFGPSIIFINFSYPHLYTRLHSFSTTSSIHVARGRRDTSIRHQHQLCLPRTQDYQAFPLVLFRLQAISSSHTFNRTHARAHTHQPEIGLAIGHLLGWWMQGWCILGFWDWARWNPMQKFYEPQEAQLPVSVSDPVLEDDVKWHWWAKAKFLAKKRYQMSNVQ